MRLDFWFALSIFASYHLLTVSAAADHTVDWSAQIERREAVKTAFLYNYEQYEQNAFGYDQLRPVSRDGIDSNVLAGWGGTIVDAMSTMLVMNLSHTPAYRRALEHVRRTDFTKTYMGDEAGEVSNFEITIRFVAGLLSAYQLGGERKDERFLVEQATVIADGLANAWGLGTRIPHNKVNINLGRPVPDLEEPANLAEAGTLTIEWGMLSKYTKNETYRSLVKGSMDAILETRPVFPGLWAQGIWPDTERTHKDYVTWGGGSDSFIEYLIKYPLLLGDDRHPYLGTYAQTVRSSIDYLLQKTGVGNLTFFSDWSKSYGHGPIYSSSHLEAFAGGNIAMAGRVLKQDEWVQIGLELAESSAATYRMSATGVGPIIWAWIDAAGKSHGHKYVSPARRAFYAEKGVYFTAQSWNHQPEVTESILHAYRITGQNWWRDWAWEAFERIRFYCDTGKHGWTGLENVNDKSGGVYDQQQSFLYAEYFKYLYLIFDHPDTWSLDDWVFNTEAHPFKRAPNKNFGKIQRAPFPYRRITSDQKDVARPIALPIPEPLRTPKRPPPDEPPPATSRPPSSSSFPFAEHVTLSVQQDAAVDAALGPPNILHRLSQHVSGLDACRVPEQSWMRAVVCRAHTYLLWPFALLAGYRVSLIVGRCMRRYERQMYRRPAHVV